MLLTVNVFAGDSYTISWDRPLSDIGGFMDNKELIPADVTNSDIATISDYGYKQIMYTDENGNKKVANPYTADSIKIKAGTKVYFQMYCGNAERNRSRTGMQGTNSVYGLAGEVISSGIEPTENMTITKNEDKELINNANQKYIYWSVKVLNA